MTTAPVLVTFACTRCGRSVEAVASASVTHRCPHNQNRTTPLEATK